MNNKLLWFVTAVQVHLLAPREDKERGATATEYALLVALIAVVIAVGVAAFGSDLNTFFDGLWAKVTAANGNGNTP